MVAEMDRSLLPDARRQDLGAVRLEASGRLILAREVAELLGRGRVGVVPLGRGRFGLQPSRAYPGLLTLALQRITGGTRAVSATGTLMALGKRRPASVVDLPFSWDGDMLVVNVSMLDESEVRFDGR